MTSLPTPTEVAEFRAEEARAARYVAILTLASRIKQFDATDLEAVAELADDDGIDLATMAINNSLWGPI